MPPTDLLHFVGFKGDEYPRAVRVFGRPDFVHRGWDLRAKREVAPGDTVVFAKGDFDQPPRAMSFNDLDEEPAR
jgi:hypothetical protein